MTLKLLIAWPIWLGIAAVAAVGLRSHRVTNDLDDWVVDARAVGVYQSYVVVGWDLSACDAATVAARLRTAPSVALCLDPVNVSTFGRFAGVTPDDFVLGRNGRYAGAFCFSRPGVPDEQVVAEVRAALAADARTASVDFAFGGPAVYHAALNRVSQHGLPEVMAAIALVGMLMLWWVTGRFTHAVAAVIAISLTQLILMGLIGWLRIPLDLSISMVPPLMMCLGFSYAAHRSLHARNAAVLALCALTTAAGIGSFVFASLPPVRRFALFGMIGLALVWLAAATLLPAPVKRRRIWFRPAFAMFIRVRRGVGRAGIGIAAILLSLGAVACVPLLRFENDSLNIFPTDTPEVADFRRLNDTLTGMLPFQVTVEAVEHNGTVQRSVPDVAPLLRQAPGVRKVIETSLFTAKNGAAAQRVYWCLADNDALLALKAAELGWHSWADAQGAHLTWRGVAAQLAGADRVVARSAAWSLPVMVCLAAIAAGVAANGPIKARAYLAIVGGWVSVLPAAALIVLAAVMRLPLGPPALMIGAITIGVAVDDTLHFASALHRRKCVSRAIWDCWRPCAGSSAVAVLTLATFALSPFQPTRQFGLLMSIAVVFALLANQLVLPALVKSLTGRIADKASLASGGRRRKPNGRSLAAAGRI